MNHFKFFSKKDILSLTKVRRYETKIGERIQHLRHHADWPEALVESPAKYVMLGIPEDIGVKANMGMGGADTNWVPFLSSFLNQQSNDFFTGESILLLGHFDFGDMKYLIETNASDPEERIIAYRHAVHTLDEEIEVLIKTIAAAGKIPLVIGGGHNNAYPLIKGVSKGLYKTDVLPLAQINCINLDTHADFQPMEGRHSGNGFRYAEADGFLGKYCIVGLDENHIPQTVLHEIHENPFIKYSSFEDIFLYERLNFIQAVAQATGFTEDNYTGVEIDLDAIEYALCSNHSPSGITLLQARQFVHFVGTDAKVAYLHIAEGASQLGDGEKDEQTGRLISYLVTDFVKANGRVN